MTLARIFERFSDCRPDLAPTRFGILESCDGGLVEVSGLPVPVGSLCTIEHEPTEMRRAEVIGFRDGRAILSLLGEAVSLAPGARVRASARPGMLPVGEAFLGRAVDGLAQPVDGGPPPRPDAEWPANGKRVGPLDRASVTTPLATGIRAIDGLLTTGIGQRMGIVAGSGVGKSVLMDMIVKGAESDVVVVGLIGERAREVSDFVRRHMHGNLAARTAIVAVPADDAPNLRLRGALQATALAEYFRAQGRRVLLLLDSLTRVAHAAREIALMLGESGAARGYPPSALGTITRLCERAGNSAQSGGSITAFYTVLADGDDANDPVVDTARAILDGHIVLSRARAQRGCYPAIDVPASISRTMMDIAPPEQVAAARSLRALIATYDENRDLLAMGAYRPGADAILDRAVERQAEIETFLAQDRDVRVAPGQVMTELNRALGHE